MSGKCKNCGYSEGLHQTDTDRCPLGGEAPFGSKQEWLETTFVDEDIFNKTEKENIKNLLKENLKITIDGRSFNVLFDGELICTVILKSGSNVA